MATFRIFRVCSTGPYQEMFSAFVAGLGAIDYDAKLAACRRNGFLYPADFKSAMEDAGAEVMEAIIDQDDLQRQWLAESGEAPTHDKVETFFKQMQAFRPDVVHFQTLSVLSNEWRKLIKARCPSVKLVTGHRGFPCFDCVGYEDVDAMFLGYPRHHDYWRAVGVRRTFHQDHAFDASLLPEVGSDAASRKIHDFTFIGTTGWGFPPHDGRYYDMRKLLERTALEIWGNEPAQVQGPLRVRSREAILSFMQHMPMLSIKLLSKLGQWGGPDIFIRAANATFQRKSALARRRRAAKAGTPDRDEYWYLKEKPIGALYPSRIHAPVFGLEYLRLLASSRVSWNRQLEMDGAGANMRLFEACGVGSCQISDIRPEVAAVYEPDKEIVVYSSIEECVDKVNYLLENESVRRKIAAAGQARTLRDHTTTRRAKEMHRQLLEMLS
ncbi:MAG: glycosyltransferase [Alphaproteobacteria bacterium]